MLTRNRNHVTEETAAFSADRVTALLVTRNPMARL